MCLVVNLQPGQGKLGTSLLGRWRESGRNSAIGPIRDLSWLEVCDLVTCLGKMACCCGIYRCGRGGLFQEGRRRGQGWKSLLERWLDIECFSTRSLLTHFLEAIMRRLLRIAADQSTKYSNRPSNQELCLCCTFDIVNFIQTAT